MTHFHTADVHPAHAAAAVDQEDELALGAHEVRGHGLEVGTEVQHDHRVVEDVLVEPLA